MLEARPSEISRHLVDGFLHIRLHVLGCLAQQLILLHHILQFAFSLHDLLQLDVFLLDFDIFVFDDRCQVTGKVFVSFEITGFHADCLLELFFQLFDQLTLGRKFECQCPYLSARVHK